MAKGGYKIISLKNKNITVGGASVSFPGIYDAIEGAYRKAILLSDVVINNTECYDRFVVFGNDEGSFVSQISIDGDINLLKLTVADDDTVSIVMN